MGLISRVSSRTYRKKYLDSVENSTNKPRTNMAPIRGGSKMGAYMNHRMRATLKDGRTFVGTLKSFDKHMNLILVDTDEYRQVRPKKGQVINEQKRPLGFVLLRGEHLCTLSVEGPPPNEDEYSSMPNMTGALQSMNTGGATGRPAGRGMPVQQAQAARPDGLAAGSGTLGNPGRGMERRYN